MTRDDFIEKFLEGAVDQAALVGSFSVAALGFCLVAMLQIFGLRDGELTPRSPSMRLLYLAVISSAVSVVLAFGIRMAAVGYFFDLGIRAEAQSDANISSIGTTMTWFAVIQLLIAGFGALFTILWVFKNRRI